MAALVAILLLSMPARQLYAKDHDLPPGYENAVSATYRIQKFEGKYWSEIRVVHDPGEKKAPGQPPTPDLIQARNSEDQEWHTLDQGILDSIPPASNLPRSLQKLSSRAPSVDSSYGLAFGFQSDFGGRTLLVRDNYGNGGKDILTDHFDVPLNQVEKIKFHDYWGTLTTSFLGKKGEKSRTFVSINSSQDGRQSFQIDDIFHPSLKTLVTKQANSKADWLEIRDNLGTQNVNLTELGLEREDTRAQVPAERQFGNSINQGSGAKPRGSKRSQTARTPRPSGGGSPLNSPQIQTMANFSRTVNERIIGQENAVSRIQDSTLKNFLDPRPRKRGTAMMLVGESGGGKTELAKAMAEAKGGPFRVIPMGQIQDEQGIASFLGAGKGYVGSDSPGWLVAALKAMPDGGVIVLDEISNVGGKGREAEATRTTVYMALYNMLDEGRYEDPSTGKTFKLSNYDFILTGNDGEHLFQGALSDDRRMQAWEENRQGIKDLLLQHGMLAALLGRLDDVVLMEPTTVEKLKQITERRFLRPWVDSFQKKYKGVTIDYDPELPDQMASMFFSPTEGARSIRKIVDDRLGSAMAQVIFENRAALKDSKLDAHLSFRDTAPDAKPGSQEEKNRKILLEVNYQLGGESKSMTRDVTEFVGRNYLLGMKSANPLESPRLLNRLQNIAPVMKNRVIGQDPIMDSVGDMITAHFMNPKGQKRPMTMMLVGPTGIGKTETGKAIGAGLYGSDSEPAVIIHELGKYDNPSALDDEFFGTPEKMGLFETSLRDSMNGGVHIFDEISNMGGNNPEVKKLMFKKFYQMLEEGKWTSPKTKITYDLSPHFFLFTGNDGEDLFKGVTDDDERQKIWAENRDRTILEHTLLNAGVPEAFLGRIDGLYMGKPLTRPDIAKIIKGQFLNPLIKSYESQYKGLKIEPDPQFVDQLASLFFRQGGGARSVRRVVDGDVSAAIGQALLSFSPSEGASLNDAPVFRLELKDTREGSGSGKVDLEVHYAAGGEDKVVVRDLTARAEPVFSPKTPPAKEPNSMADYLKNKQGLSQEESNLFMNLATKVCAQIRNSRSARQDSHE